MHSGSWWPPKKNIAEHGKKSRAAGFSSVLPVEYVRQESRMRRAVMIAFLLTRLPSAASIQGIVVEYLSSRPELRLAAIGRRELGPTAKPARHHRAVSLFRDGVGDYLLRASRGGFAELRCGQKTWKADGAPLCWPSRTAIMWRSLRLRRLGAVAGTMWDENQVGSTRPRVRPR